ncbi:helix-turn-helix transcriptional regulator [Aeromicrobium alkaliterrae]|uniref:DNA-binding protein n=1 Tax=Aeromicrobium alkaliterrae TaxID=302168 RepID=A0ABN2KDX3_9ACTN
MKPRELLTPKEAADYLGITAEALAERHQQGTGPNYVPITKTITRYLVEDLDEWQNT